jgi:SAM-dependent methyltransferase
MPSRRFHAIAHRDHDHGNPLAAVKIERLLDLLPLDAKSRVLDLGCGRAELALRLIERFGSTVFGVENSPLMLDAARERAEWTGALGRLHLDDTDPREFRADPETFHLSAMLGIQSVAGGLAGACRTLREWTAGGGYVLVGRGFWQQRPRGEYLRIMEMAEGDLLDHRGNVQAGVDAGLIPMHACTASLDEWDEYEWKFCRSIERYAREQPDDPEVPAMIERIRRRRDAYLRWGRDTMGFGLYLFYRPGARIG